VVVEVPKPNTRSNIGVAKPQTFNREIEKMAGFLTLYKLYIDKHMKEEYYREFEGRKFRI